MQGGRYYYVNGEFTPGWSHLQSSLISAGCPPLCSFDSESTSSVPSMISDLCLVVSYREAIAAIDAVIHDPTSFDVDTAMDQDPYDEESEIDSGVQNPTPRI